MEMIQKEWKYHVFFGYIVHPTWFVQGAKDVKQFRFELFA